MNAYFNLLLKKFYAFSKHLEYFLFCFWFFLHVISSFKTLEETVFIWQEAIKIYVSKPLCILVDAF